jgi:hypothetical protein
MLLMVVLMLILPIPILPLNNINNKSQCYN